MAPIPNPAPVLAFTPIAGMYVSKILKVAAAVNAINAISSRFNDFFGIALVLLNLLTDNRNNKVCKIAK